MKDFFVRDAEQHENQVVISTFVVASKQVKPRRTGEPYLSLTLADRTGHIDAKLWDNVHDVIDAFEQDDFVKIKGLINKYNTRFQLTVHKLRKLDESEIDFADYLPKTTKDIDELWRTLGSFVASFQDQRLQSLVQAFMDDEQIAAAYKTAPAAKSMHHAYIGGLLDHVVSLMKLCDLACRNYPQIDRDLLLTGAFLHDIGKIHELCYARSFGYTTRGQLLGHMIIELEMLQAKLAQFPDFPEELKFLLEHLIISHHGHYEFGSPKLPMFPEALMLHYLDDLDSKMESMRAQFEIDADNDSGWTRYNSSLARTLLNSQKLLQNMRNPEPCLSQSAAEREDAEPDSAGPEPDSTSTAAASAASAGPAGEAPSPTQQQLLDLERKFSRSR